MNSNKKVLMETLPQRHKVIIGIKRTLRRIEQEIILHPDDDSFQIVANELKEILALAEHINDAFFMSYAKEFAEKIKEPLYPYSLKTWYEDDFKPFMDEYKNEQ